MELATERNIRNSTVFLFLKFHKITMEEATEKFSVGILLIFSNRRNKIYSIFLRNVCQIRSVANFSL